MWNVEEMDEEIEVLPLEDALKMCVDNFNCLRRLLANPRAANPWSIDVRRELIEEIFLHIIHSVQECVSAFGVTVENNRINFSEKEPLIRDLSKLSGIPKDDILNSSLKKYFRGKREGFLAKVLVSTDKPFIISYDM